MRCGRLQREQIGLGVSSQSQIQLTDVIAWLYADGSDAAQSKKTKKSHRREGSISGVMSVRYDQGWDLLLA